MYILGMPQNTAIIWNKIGAVIIVLNAIIFIFFVVISDTVLRCCFVISKFI